MRGIFLVFGLMAIANSALAGDAQRGLLLARTWCAECHIVAPGERGSDTGPPFSVIAKSTEPSGVSLRQWSEVVARFRTIS